MSKTISPYNKTNKIDKRNTTNILIASSFSCALVNTITNPL